MLKKVWDLRGQEGIVKSARWELKGTSLVSMAFFLLDIMLTLSWHCRSFWGLHHGHCQLLIEFPSRLTSPNLCMACNNTLNQHYIVYVVLHIILQSIIAFHVTFKDKTEPVFNQALKAWHAGFVIDTYIKCISSSL